MQPRCRPRGPGGSASSRSYADAQNNPAAADPLTSGDYVVEAVNPVDNVNNQQTSDPTNGGYISPGGTTDKRLYRFTDETAINVMTGDTYVPQEGYAASTDPGGGGYTLVGGSGKVRKDVNSLGAGTVAKCGGGLQKLPDNSRHPPSLALQTSTRPSPTAAAARLAAKQCTCATPRS